MAYETGLTRRLSLITYLNKSWKHEYSGDSKIFKAMEARCEAAVEPLFNRTVIFEIANQKRAILQSPIKPDGRCRNSFLVAYHTAEARNFRFTPAERQVLRWEIRKPWLELASKLFVRRLSPAQLRKL